MISRGLRTDSRSHFGSLNSQTKIPIIRNEQIPEFVFYQTFQHLPDSMEWDLHHKAPAWDV